jgi:hypothetical protein
MSKAEPAILIILLGLVLATLTARLMLGRYMSATLEALDCRLGYYGLLSLATHYPNAAVSEIEGWTLVKFRDGHYLFSKPGAQGHPMAVLRTVEEVEGRPKVRSEGCAFGDREGYKAAMAQLPPVAKILPEVPGAGQSRKVEDQ